MKILSILKNKLKPYKNINKYYRYKKYKKIIYLLEPDHGNLGDQAITFATRAFLEEYFEDYMILEFDRDEIYSEYIRIKKCMNKNDIIILHGGGNIGNLYGYEELARRYAIKKFKRNTIISMPQTMSFTDDVDGKKQKEITKKIYNKHKKLLLLAREDKTYKDMKKLFNTSIIKVPDIVLFLKGKISGDEERIMITTCLRDDKESILLDKKDKFIEELKNNYENVFITDTNLNRNLVKEERIIELEKIWSDFKKSKVVITDRLHGMIFCAITNTPCIVLKSLDHKISESYKWLNELEFIELVDDLDFVKLEKRINRLCNIKIDNNISFEKEYYEKLAEDIKSFCIN